MFNFKDQDKLGVSRTFEKLKSQTFVSGVRYDVNGNALVIDVVPSGSTVTVKFDDGSQMANVVAGQSYYFDGQYSAITITSPSANDVIQAKVGFGKVFQTGGSAGTASNVNVVNTPTTISETNIYNNDTTTYEPATGYDFDFYNVSNNAVEQTAPFNVAGIWVWDQVGESFGAVLGEVEFNGDVAEYGAMPMMTTIANYVQGFNTTVPANTPTIVFNKNPNGIGLIRVTVMLTNDSDALNLTVDGSNVPIIFNAEGGTQNGVIPSGTSAGVSFYVPMQTWSRLSLDSTGEWVVAIGFSSSPVLPLA